MLVPAWLLLGAEVRAVEEFLQAQHLNATPPGLVDERQMLVEHPLFDVVGAAVERNVCLDLYQSAAYTRPMDSCRTSEACLNRESALPIAS